jgi:hypothetical protein
VNHGGAKKKKKGRGPWTSLKCMKRCVEQNDTTSWTLDSDAVPCIDMLITRTQTKRHAQTIDGDIEIIAQIMSHVVSRTSPMSDASSFRM